MRFKPALIVSYFILFSLVFGIVGTTAHVRIGAVQTELEVNVSEDTYIESDRAEVNGNKRLLEVRFSRGAQTNFLSYPLLKFDLTTLPHGARILSVKLLVVVSLPRSPLNVGTYLSSYNTWSESTLTWANASFVDQTSDDPSDSKLVTTAGRTFEFNLGPISTFEGKTAFTVIMKPANVGPATSTGVVQFYSKEHTNPEQRPKLKLTYELATTAPATTAPTITTMSRITQTSAPSGTGFLGSMALPIGGAIAAVVAIAAFALFTRRGKGTKPAVPAMKAGTKPAMEETVQVSPPAPKQPQVPPKPQTTVPKLEKGTILISGTPSLDEALRGGVPQNSATLLLSPPSVECDNMVTNLLRSACGNGYVSIYITSRERESISLLLDEYPDFHVLICHSAAESMYFGRPNVYRSPLEMNQITSRRLEMERKVLSDPRPKIVAMDILSALILASTGKAVRFWLTDLLEKLKKRNAITFAVMNPEALPKEDVRMVAEIFDGEIEIVEVVEKAQKFVVVKRMTEREFKKEPVRLT